ncbi:MAG: 30S ribosomal protein S27ae [Thermoplasmataceae archaeon]|jgi:small subunit ribosomal protein S27Ae
MLKREIYKVENDKLMRQRRFCPKCGPGVFLAEHEDRFTCGKCRYTEFKKKEKSPENKPKQ